MTNILLTLRLDHLRGKSEEGVPIPQYSQGANNDSNIPNLQRKLYGPTARPKFVFSGVRLSQQKLELKS